MVVALLAVAAALAGCSSRDHTNPFDPENDDTNGRPRLVSAAARDGAVDVHWQLPDFEDIDQVDLVRIDDAEQEVVLDVDVLAADSVYTDSTVVNDRTYRYVLQFRFDGESTPQRSAESAATPGRLVIWVLDQTRGGPLRVSPDARVVSARPGQGRPTDMAFDPATGRVASVDFQARRVETFDRDGIAGPFLAVVGNPQSVAIDEPTGAVWIGTANPSAIERRTPDLATSTAADTGFGDPEDMAADPTTGGLWVADSDGGRLFHRRPDGRLAVIAGFSAPFSVALDAMSGDAFLIDRARRTLLRVSAAVDTVIWSRPGFAGLYQALADPATGGVWVSDNLAGTVTLVTAGGELSTVLEGFRAPTGLAHDPGGADLWITDAGTDELLRVSRSGEIHQRLAGFDGPFAVLVTLPDAGNP
jgi:DNA-binding beta-propeller fold protein YncE